MAKYFDVQKALSDGISQSDIDAHMQSKGLQPKPIASGEYSPFGAEPSETSMFDKPSTQVGNFLGPVSKVANFFAPRQTKLAGEALDTTVNQWKTGQYKTKAPAEALTSGFGPLAQLGAGSLGRYAGNKELSRADEQLQQVAPAAGEYLSYALPAGQVKNIMKIPTALGRIGASALASGVGGVVHGATSPDKMSVMDRASKATTEGAVAAATAALLTGGIEVGKAIMQKTFKPLANFIANRTMRPDAGKGTNWAAKTEEADKILFEQTKGITPEQISKSASQRIGQITKEVESGLKKSDISYYSEGAQTRMRKSLEQQIPLLRDAEKMSKGAGRGGAVSDLTEGMKEIKFASNDVIGLLDRAAQAKGGLPAEQKLNAFDLFKIKQQLGEMTRGIWDKVANDRPISASDQVYLQGYENLLEMIDDLAPDMSALTHIQHQLHNIISGAYTSLPKVGGSSFGRIATSTIAQPLLMGVARGANALGANHPALNTAVQALTQGGVSAGVANTE